MIAETFKSYFNLDSYRKGKLGDLLEPRNGEATAFAIKIFLCNL